LAFQELDPKAAMLGKVFADRRRAKPLAVEWLSLYGGKVRIPFAHRNMF
jgi:hypothetical protein